MKYLFLPFLPFLPAIAYYCIYLVINKLYIVIVVGTVPKEVGTGRNMEEQVGTVVRVPTFLDLVGTLKTAIQQSIERFSAKVGTVGTVVPVFVYLKKRT